MYLVKEVQDSQKVVTPQLRDLIATLTPYQEMLEKTSDLN
jgi:hypothetical protein